MNKALFILLLFSMPLSGSSASAQNEKQRQAETSGIEIERKAGAQDADPLDPLISLTFKGGSFPSVEVVEQRIREGANVNHQILLRARMITTPLHRVVPLQNKRLAMLLLAYGSDPRLKNSYFGGETPAEYGRRLAAPFQHEASMSAVIVVIETFPCGVIPYSQKAAEKATEALKLVPVPKELVTIIKDYVTLRNFADVEQQLNISGDYADLVVGAPTKKASRCQQMSCAVQ